MPRRKQEFPSFETIVGRIHAEDDPDNPSVHVTERMITAAQNIFEKTTYDNLTGLLRRDVFGERVESWVRKNPDDFFTLAYIDLDKFKNINTQYGHAGGNDVLRAVGAGIGRAFQRTGEAASRLGGDEFSIMIPRDHEKGDDDEEDLNFRGQHSEDDLRDYIEGTIVASVLDQVSEADAQRMKKILKLSIGLVVLSAGQARGKELDELLETANMGMFVDKLRPKPDIEDDPPVVPSP